MLSIMTCYIIQLYITETCNNKDYNSYNDNNIE